jgi:hypothetical protein
VRRTSDRGFAVIGAAMTLPIVLLGSVGAMEVGRAYQTSQALTQAAREGARAAVRQSADLGGADARIRERLQMSGLRSDETVGVSVTGSEVTISYPFHFVVLQPVAQLLVSGSMVDSPITVTASVTRNEAGS